MKIGYKLVKNNMPATAEKAPYLGMAIPVGSLAYDNILREMIDGGTKMSLATARYFLEAFYDYAAKKIAADAVRINTGTVAIYPMIDGSFDSEDAEFDPERNSLYVGATLSQSLRDRVAGIVPDSTGEDVGGTVKMDRIYDIESQTRGVISGTSPFRISGRNLTVPDTEDESLALYAKDGVTKVTDITVSETDGGNLFIGGEAGAQLAALYDEDSSKAYERVKFLDPDGEGITFPMQSSGGKLNLCPGVAEGAQVGDVYTLKAKVEDTDGELHELSHEYVVE